MSNQTSKVVPYHCRYHTTDGWVSAYTREMYQCLWENDMTAPQQRVQFEELNALFLD